jgi:hypothetical protein
MLCTGASGDGQSHCFSTNRLCGRRARHLSQTGIVPGPICHFAMQSAHYRELNLVREAAKVYRNVRHSGHLMPSVQTTSALLNAMAGAQNAVGIDLRRGRSRGAVLQNATRKRLHEPLSVISLGF